MRRLSDWCQSLTRSAAVYALTKWLNCSPIYVVNRDDAEVEQFIDAFKKTATEAFNPELVHVKTVEEAEKLASPGTFGARHPALRKYEIRRRRRTRKLTDARPDFVSLHCLGSSGVPAHVAGGEAGESSRANDFVSTSFDCSEGGKTAN